MWPRGQSVVFEIRRARVQIPLGSPEVVVLSSPEFKFSASLVNNQLVRLPLVRSRDLVMFI